MVYCSFYKADRILDIVMLSFLNTVMCCYLSKNAMKIFIEFTRFKQLLSQNRNLRKKTHSRKKSSAKNAMNRLKIANHR